MPPLELVFSLMKTAVKVTSAPVPAVVGIMILGTPGFFIFLTTLSIYLIGDGLRDALDPWVKE